MRKFQKGGMTFTPSYQFPRRITNPNAQDSLSYQNAFQKAQQIMTGPQRPWVQRRYGNELIFRQNAGFGNPMSNAASRDFVQQATTQGYLRPMQSGGFNPRPSYNMMSSPTAEDSAIYRSAFYNTPNMLLPARQGSEYGNQLHADTSRFNPYVLMNTDNVNIKNKILNQEEGYRDYLNQTRAYYSNQLSNLPSNMKSHAKALGLYQQGGSIVDYLKSQGKDSSKSARRSLAQSMGLRGDLSAQDNLALLETLQSQQTAPVARGFDNRIVAVPDVNLETGAPMEILVNTPQLVSQTAVPEMVTAPRPKPRNRKSTSEMARNRRTSVVKAIPELDGDKTSYEGTDKFFQRAPWMMGSSRRPRPRNPVASSVPDSDYKKQVLDGQLRGRDLGRLRSEGKISNREYNQLYSILRNNGIVN